MGNKQQKLDKKDFDDLTKHSNCKKKENIQKKNTKPHTHIDRISFILPKKSFR